MLKALVPVRAGSERVINKNIRAFAGSSLLELKVNQLLRIPEIDEVCVSSDCSDMLSLASRLGATPVERDPAYATSDIAMNDVYEHLALSMDCDDVLYTNVTSPLVTDETYRECIEKYFSLSDHDSLSTVTLLKENLWLNGLAINYDPDYHPRSQDLPDIVYLNFAINIIKRSDMLSRRNVIGNKFYPWILGKIESMDIDDEEDFKIAELIYQEEMHQKEKKTDAR
jgi:CMP-N-acetylneuraminic acid synthetase